MRGSEPLGQGLEGLPRPGKEAPLHQNRIKLDFQKSPQRKPLDDQLPTPPGLEIPEGQDGTSGWGWEVCVRRVGAETLQRAAHSKPWLILTHFTSSGSWFPHLLHGSLSSQPRPCLTWPSSAACPCPPPPPPHRPPRPRVGLEVHLHGSHWAPP